MWHLQNKFAGLNCSVVKKTLVQYLTMIWDVTSKLFGDLEYKMKVEYQLCSKEFTKGFLLLSLTKAFRQDGCR